MIGRYFAMDRDKRWDRDEAGLGRDRPRARGRCAGRPGRRRQNAITRPGKTDEFMPPLDFRVPNEPRPLIADGDGVLFFNFRGDRARQLSRRFCTRISTDSTARLRPKVHYLTLTQYDATLRFAIDVSARNPDPYPRRSRERGRASSNCASPRRRNIRT